jgi:murein DD-endopeptidase MepM/ murein hydrolase activator NlpD
MAFKPLERARQAVLRACPDRRIYLSSEFEVRTFVLSTSHQVLAAVGLALLLTWTSFTTVSLVVSMALGSSQDAVAARTQAYYERLIADRQARLNAAMARLSGGSGSMDALAHIVAERHAALALLFTGLHPGAAAVNPMPTAALVGRSPTDQIQAVVKDQDRLLAAAEGYAHSRAERLRLAFHLAGLEPSAYTGRAAGGEALGGPLIEVKDPRALGAVLDVDPDFAARIQRAALDLDATHSLDQAARQLPLGVPVKDASRSSPYGVRLDPFTRHEAFHPGQDFAGAFMTPIQASAPGVIAFTGQRTGYGNVVEIDHGGGFKTRYAHLQAIAVRVGQRVALGQRIGAMGSTGRSTGVHLHYEVWQNGRLQDPARFLKAGEYVQQD